MNKKRILERLPALMSWTIIIAPIVFSIWYPAQVGFFLVGFVFLWFFRTMEYSIFLVRSFILFKKILKKDFSAELQSFEVEKKFTKKNKEIYSHLQDHNVVLHPSKVEHIVMIATCGEPIEVLRDTLDSVQNSVFDMQKVTIVLAREERITSSKKLGEDLQKEYAGVFKDFYVFAHPDSIAGEVRGKGGNITHAGRELTKILESQNADLENFLVTTLDADNRFHEQYLNSLTLKYVQTGDRQHCSYQPIPLFFNNIWEVPMLNRMISIAGGFWHMVESARPHRLHNFSSHAQPLLALKQMGFWAVDTIVEDGHQYWRSYFHFNGEYHVEPLFIPIYQDAVQNKTWHKTLVAQYKQIRRWAWGCTDIPFVITNWHAGFAKLPFMRTLLHFLRLIEGHIFWATGAIVITLATPIPGFINGQFSESGYGIAMPHLLSFFFNMAAIGIILMVLFSILTLPKPPKKYKYILVVLQWIFIPIMTIFFGAIPALEAQTRLFFGKYLGFNVTEKIRRDETTEKN